MGSVKPFSVLCLETGEGSCILMQLTQRCGTFTEKLLHVKTSQSCRQLCFISSASCNAGNMFSTEHSKMSMLQAAAMNAVVQLNESGCAQGKLCPSVRGLAQGSSHSFPLARDMGSEAEAEALPSGSETAESCEIVEEGLPSATLCCQQHCYQAILDEHGPRLDEISVALRESRNNEQKTMVQCFV